MAPNFSLFPYQQPAVDTLDRLNGKGGLWCDPRVGKTRMAYAYLHGRAKRTLVVAPTSGPFIWEKEAERVGLDQPVRLCIDGSVRDRANDLAAFGDGVAVVTYPAYWREPLRSSILAWAPDAVVLDEIQAIKRRTTAQAKFAHRLEAIPQIEHRIGLSGTPQTQGLEDWFSIYRFVDPRVLGRSWDAFEANYVIYSRWTDYPKIEGYRNEPELRAKIAATSYRVTEEEAYPYLPRAIEELVPVRLTAESARRYKQFKRDALLEIDGVGTDGRPLRGLALARIAMVATTRLQQLTSGSITTDAGPVDVSSEKLDLCADLVRTAHENNQSVTIFCKFRRDVARVAARLGVPPEDTITGDTPARMRGEIVDRLQAGRLRTLVGQIRSISRSIELSACRVGIFFSIGFELEHYLQARMRFGGPNQTGRVTLYHLVASGTVDEKVLAALQDKHDLASSMIDRAAVRRLFE